MNGRPVSAFWAMLSGPGHLIAPDVGTYEFTRVYFHDGHFNLGYARDHLGPQRVLAVLYSTTDGMTVVLKDYCLHVPCSALKLCWKP